MAGVMKQSKVGLGAVLAACLAVSLIQSSLASAASHTVGDSTGWTVPSSSSFYSSWAAKQKFERGDFLVFNFQSGSHTVAEVSKSDYDGCSSSNPISSASSGPANLTISTTGNHYYICTIPSHCSKGQKLAITASGSSSSAPTPSATAPTPSSSSGSPGLAPSPSSSATIPSALSPVGGAAAAPPPSSASVAGAGLALPFVMIAAAFLG